MRTFYFLVLIYFFSGVIFSYKALARTGDDTHLRTNNKYNSNLLQMGTSYKAKLYCSCLFQMKLSEKYCQQFVAVDPEVFQISTNQEEKSIQARALFLLYPIEAKHLGDEKGCTIEKDRI